MCDSEDENYATFGIPLEPLDEENLPRKKAVTVEDQYAYDAQGRRRFHGAFTGGFSAGYFNTVGTRDGWKPQQFKSSRGSKAKAVEQQPEDFMDEEDVSIFGIAPKGIRANSDYEYHGQRGTKRGRAETIDDRSLSHNPVLKELLRPVRETVGRALLKKMGWRPGQGIGNRVTKREKIKTKRRMARIKVYGCSLPNEEEKEMDGNVDSDDENVDVTFAPDDYEPFKSKGKDNYFGIGYSGLNRQNVLSSRIDAESNYQSGNKSLPIYGHAFGVGAFEADDDDIYEREDMSRYDSVLGPERKSKTRWSKDNVISSDNGNNSIDGFVEAKEKLNYRKTFAPPCLPKDYRAIHLARKSRFFPPIPHRSINERRKNLNVVERAKILGDVDITENANRERIDATARSFTSKSSTLSFNAATLEASEATEASSSRTERDKAEEGIEKAETKKNPFWVERLSTKTFVSGGVTGTENITFGLSNVSKNVVTSDREIPKSPFLSDPEKRGRFEEFLARSKANKEEKSEKDEEFVEFEEAAKSIERTSNSDTRDARTDRSVEEKVEAAKMEMFGKLTRETIEWQPASIVCKRFNVPEPRNNCMQPRSEKKVKFSVFNSLDLDAPSRFLKATTAKAIRNDEEETVNEKEEATSSTSMPEDESTRNTEATLPVSVSVSVSVHSKTDVMNLEAEATSERVKNFETSYEKIFGKTVLDVVEATIKYPKYNPKEERSFEEESKMPNAEESRVSLDIEKSVERGEDMGYKENSEEKKDLFRAIFLSSSSSEESESEAEGNIDNELVKSVLIGGGDSSNDIVNASRNMSPPRGIFAKLDLDELVTKNQRVDTSADVKSYGKNESHSSVRRAESPTILEENRDNKKSDTPSPPRMPMSAEVYGPMLPSRLIKDGNVSSMGSTGNTEFSRPVCKSVVVARTLEEIQGKWVELRKTKKSKKVKKKHKHKEHKSSKSKRKSKKHKR